MERAESTPGQQRAKGNTRSQNRDQPGAEAISFSDLPAEVQFSNPDPGMMPCGGVEMWLQDTEQCTSRNPFCRALQTPGSSRSRRGRRNHRGARKVRQASCLTRGQMHALQRVSRLLPAPQGALFRIAIHDHRIKGRHRSAAPRNGPKCARSTSELLPRPV